MSLYDDAFSENRLVDAALTSLRMMKYHAIIITMDANNDRESENPAVRKYDAPIFDNNDYWCPKYCALFSYDFQ